VADARASRRARVMKGRSGGVCGCVMLSGE
jgi:hypothetical protein